MLINYDEADTNKTWGLVGLIQIRHDLLESYNENHSGMFFVKLDNNLICLW